MGESAPQRPIMPVYRPDAGFYRSGRLAKSDLICQHSALFFSPKSREAAPRVWRGGECIKGRLHRPRARWGPFPGSWRWGSRARLLLPSRPPPSTHTCPCRYIQQPARHMAIILLRMDLMAFLLNHSNLSMSFLKKFNLSLFSLLSSNYLISFFFLHFLSLSLSKDMVACHHNITHNLLNTRTPMPSREPQQQPRLCR